MKGVTLVINGQDFSPVLSSYKCSHVPEIETELRTMDGVNHQFGVMSRTEIRFSVLPVAYGNKLDVKMLRKRPMTVKYSDFENGDIRTAQFTTDSERQYTFLLRNILGDDMYKIGEITLRGVYPDADNE